MIILPVQTNNYRKNLLQCYNHLTAAVVDRDRRMMRIVLFMEDIGRQTTGISHIHLIHLVTHIVMLTTPLMAIRHTIHRTLTCIKMRKEFMKVLILVAILLIFETLTIVKGKLSRMMLNKSENIQI